MTQIWVVHTVQFWQRHNGYTSERHTQSCGNIHTNMSVRSGEISLNCRQGIHTTCVSGPLEAWHRDQGVISGYHFQGVVWQIWGIMVLVTSTVIQFRAVLLTLAIIATAHIPTAEATCSSKTTYQKKYILLVLFKWYCCPNNMCMIFLIVK